MIGDQILLDMTVDFGGYEFEGPYWSPSETQIRNGVYVVACMQGDDVHCILYIGESSQVRKRLKNHGEKQCWRENVHGEIGYFVHYTGANSGVNPAEHVPPNVRRLDEYPEYDRNQIETELFWKYDPACGTNEWDAIEDHIERYNGFEETFGERGNGELPQSLD